MENKREDWIDVIRIFAVFCIIVGHCLKYGQVLRNIIYVFHVPILFFISGYLFKPGSKIPSKWSSVIVKKISQLLLPFWFCVFVQEIGLSLLSNALHTKIEFVQPEGISLKRLIVDLSFYYGYISKVFLWTFWFLPTLFSVWLIMFFLTRKKDNISTQIVVIVLAFGISCAVDYLPPLFTQFFARFKILAPPDFSLVPTNIPPIYKIFGFLRDFACIPFFIAGYWFKKYSWLNYLTKSRIGLIVPACIGIGLTILIYLHYQITIHQYQYGRYYFFFAASVSIIVTLLILARKINKFPVFLLFAGKNSLFIMAWHQWLTMQYIYWLYSDSANKFFANKIAILDEIFAFIVSCLVFLFLYVMCKICCRVFKKVPVVLLLLGIRVTD